MKKIALVCLFALVGMSGVHAGMGLGIVYGGSPNNWNYSGYASSMGLSLGFGNNEEVKWEMAVRMWFQGQGESFFMKIAADADWHVARWTPLRWLQLYAGVGPYAQVGFYTHANQGNTNLTLGGRVPLGVRFILGSAFDIWLAMVPALGLDMSFGSKTQVGVGGGIGGEIGVRIWF